ncbi:SH3 domain-containing C40 family peptidase [Sulfurimonas sp.]|uniref:SH3 domain-containing C40 family peptidase n=1 Tax=Sulfurimonas sp. TaxID=2022749 RepID=UPI0025F2436C|nr:SH3 domain-containing C40 family peptidase [Sulfurimonas sp.]MBW6487616.1 SH3 domain-containing protein [Sulfurimonas sp.]
MRYIYIVLSVILFVGCSSSGVGTAVHKMKKDIFINIDENLSCEEMPKQELVRAFEIDDLQNIPQDAAYFTKNISNNSQLYDIQKRFEEHHFSIWNIEKPREDLKAVKWPFDVYTVGKSYGENLQLLEQPFFEKMLFNANFDEYATVNERGVTLKESSVRSFPTIRPLLRDPSVAGEGFPFDYLQNSALHANSPIFISHYSKDREWAYIFSNFASGWIKTSEFVVLENEHVRAWQKAWQVAIVKENEPIYDVEGTFLFKSKIGMIFALISEDEEAYTVLAISSYKNSKPLFLRSKISKDIATKEIMKLNDVNLTAVINEVSKTNYGWGGMYEQRDCSSMLRDMFAPFGIWLPRNSNQQSKIGKVISLERLSNSEKIKVIKEKAVPFETLLYKKGHIVLYVGTYDDEIIVFHNTWGIKTKKDGVEGRVIIGKPIFSTLKLGRNHKDYDESGELLRNLISMNILTQQ